MFDIFVNFRTIFINRRTGEEFDDIETIAVAYILRGRFAIDLIACIPFELISLVFKGNKILLRLERIIAYMRARELIKSGLQTLTTVVFLLLCIHWIVCLWYGTINIHKTWMPPKDSNTNETIVYSANIASRYLLIYEYAAQITNAVDFLPTNQIELICCIVICFIGRVLLGIIIVNFSDSSLELNRRQAMK